MRSYTRNIQSRFLVVVAFAMLITPLRAGVAANVKSDADVQNVLADSLANCAADYAELAGVMSNPDLLPIGTAPDVAAKMAKDYYDLEAKAFQASIALSNINSAKDRLKAYLQSYNARLKQDNNISALLPDVLPCKELMIKHNMM